MRRAPAQLLPALALAALLALLAMPALAGAGRSHPRVTFMTRNLYLGADLLPLAAADPGKPFDDAVAATLAHVEATGPVARMTLVAGEIASARPDLVGLQEVSVWRTGPLGAKPTHVVADYLKTIMSQLKRLHAPYRVVAQRLSLHLEAQTTSETIEFIDGNVVLARSGVRVSGVRSGDFRSLLKIATKALGSVTVTRSWNALDASVGAARLHLVNTQLEAYSAQTRLEQAKELVAGPLRSGRETVLVGDLNSSANLPSQADRPPFLAIAGAGFGDRRTSQPSCCFNDDLHSGRWDHIVDHIMVRPALRLVRSFLTGREKTKAGLHPSDHGGVVSILQF